MRLSMKLVSPLFFVVSPDSTESGMNKDVLVHRCYGAVSIDGKPYRVKITLKEEVGNKKLPHNTHSYEVQKIEVLDNDLPSTSNGVGTQIENPSAYPLAKLLKDIEKAYDNGEKVVDTKKKEHLKPCPLPIKENINLLSFQVLMVQR